MPGMGHCGAARAGMVNFTETAALEWAPVARSTRSRRAGSPPAAWTTTRPRWPRRFRGLHALVPLRRLGTESEVAAAIVFLLSPAAAFVSGSCLRVDGAAPNAKRIWPEVGTGGTTEAFDGFHRASSPDVLKGR